MPLNQVPLVSPSGRLWIILKIILLISVIVFFSEFLVLQRTFWTLLRIINDLPEENDLSYQYNPKFNIAIVIIKGTFKICQLSIGMDLLIMKIKLDNYYSFQVVSILSVIISTIAIFFVSVRELAIISILFDVTTILSVTKMIRMINRVNDTSLQGYLRSTMIQ